MLQFGKLSDKQNIYKKHKMHKIYSIQYVNFLKYLEYIQHVEYIVIHKKDQMFRKL